MSQKEIDIWGKPLIKMTVKDLREVAKEIPEITGVHGMKKEELIDALRAVKGIETVTPKPKVKGIGELKAQIKTLKEKRRQALEAKDKKMATVYRRRISRLKKKTRRAAA